MTKNLLHHHKAMFLTQIILKITIWKLQIVVQFNISYVIHMSIVCTRMSFVCHSCVLVCHSYVTRMYSYVIRMSLVCRRMSSVCHSYVLVCHPYVTRMWFYHEPLWLAKYQCKSSIKFNLSDFFFWGQFRRSWKRLN